ncbi:MAG: conotoxin [Porticoccaceae bacterium]|nr:conotoxin [Porticoccaceae bacterium]
MRALLIALLFLSPLVLAQESTDPQPVTDGKPATSAREPTAETTEESVSDSDFKPSEEISEDFPVPLPSDI